MQSRQKKRASALNSYAPFFPVRVLAQRIVSFILLILSGCTNSFFFPERNYYLTPDQIGLEYHATEYQSRDSTLLRGWLIPAVGEERGLVLFFHGNAQNISTHISSVHWLPKRGYSVFLADYRGFGHSEGRPDVRGAIEDIQSTVERFASEKRVPLFVFGQSIGASLLVPALAPSPTCFDLDGVILESPFESYRVMVRQVLSQLWLTWPLQWPLSFLVSDQYAPWRFAGELKGCRTLFLLSRADLVVPAEQSERLYQKLTGVKERVIAEDQPHIGMLREERFRNRLVDFLSGGAPQR